MKDANCIHFLQWALPQLQLRWQGFRRVRKQVCKRLSRRITKLGLADELAYRAYLQDHVSEWQTLVALCRVTISRFYRDKAVFNHLATELLPDLCNQLQQRGEKALRCWSAGCASGEEAYTLVLLWSFILQDQFPELVIDITATDIDPDMIQRAHMACYEFSSLKNLSVDWRHHAFEETKEHFCLHERYQLPVTFMLGDVESVPLSQPCHLILCRNLVFTYFTEERQIRFLQRLHHRIISGGVLVLGAHETLPEDIVGWRRWRSRLPIYIRE